MNTIRIAVAVTRSPVGQTAANLAAAIDWVKRARREGASIVCFPELNLTGYTTRPLITALAETIPGTVSDTLRNLAVREGITILAGLCEQGPQATCYASHIVASADGSMGVYRKLYLAQPERPVFTAAKGMPTLFRSYGSTFGIQLCYDAHFPELSTYMALRGAEIVFVPHASPRGDSEEKLRSWMRHLPARAYDNSLYIVACNQTGDNGQGLDMPGLGLIIDPSGNVLDQDASGQEGLLVVELKQSVLERVRNHHIGYFLASRRNDVYQSVSQAAHQKLESPRSVASPQKNLN
jgi:N-carbamoylputrescine amidase